MIFSTIRNLPPALAKDLAFLADVVSLPLPEEERADLLCGTLISLADKIANTVTAWSSPRPPMPLASWQAWAAARELVQGTHDGLGDAAWQYACKGLRNTLLGGYYID
jgi:hypothetical protein